jgi:toxin ParE1/3/4
VAYLALSRRALLDLDTIEGYSVGKWGRDVADQYMTMIQQALELLKEQPGLLRAKPEVSESLLFYRVKQHFLVCTLDEQNVYVLAVVHGSMDLPDRISELSSLPGR